MTIEIMENLLKKIEVLRERVVETWRILDIDRMKSKVESRKLKVSEPDFWNNREEAVRISRELEEFEKEVSEWESLRGEIRELEELVAMGAKEEDESISESVHAKYDELKVKYEKYEFLVLFSGKYDSSNAIISIHSGTGGVDAQDWAAMLERMLLRFCEKREWKVNMIDRNMGQEAGIKSVSFSISGRWAYGYLRSESGVHRLVRISPFDSESMRHTSFALIEVIPELPEAEEVIIKDDEIKIDVYKSSGPGGQGVNTTDSAVRITHLPTKTVVSCQNERSQHQNKETAMNILKSKLFKIREEEKEKKERALRGEAQKAEWGNQIRSYVMQPYKMVKDHRTKCETQNVDGVLDGDLDKFMEEYLRWARNN